LKGLNDNISALNEQRRKIFRILQDKKINQEDFTLNYNVSFFLTYIAAIPKLLSKQVKRKVISVD